jgi:FeS assembly SUF system protein
MKGMATKNFWQSMTGWINKPADAPGPEKSSSAAGPGPNEFMAQPETSAAPQPAGPDSQIFAEPPAAEVQAFSGGVPAPPPAAGASFPAPDESVPINKKIIDVIKTCYDPEIPVNIYELGLIYDVKVDEEDNAHVKMTLTAPNCPAAQSLPAEVKHKIEAMDEIKSASVEIVFDPPWNPNKMSDSAKLVLNIL